MMTLIPRLAAFLLSASAIAQSGNLGIFTDSGDVGGPAIKGSAAFYQRAVSDHRLRS